MASLKGQTIAASFQDLVKRADTYAQTGTNVEIMDDNAVVKPTGLYLESGATTDNVGIGNSVPGSLLEVTALASASESDRPSIEISSFSDANDTSTAAGVLKFHKSANDALNTYGANSHTAAGEVIGRIEAWGVTNDDDTSSDAPILSSYIEFAGDAVADETDAPGQIIFATAAADDDGVPTEAMRINDDGWVGIGTGGSISNKFHVKDGTMPQVRVQNDDVGEEVGIRLKCHSSGGNALHNDIFSLSTADTNDVGYMGFKVPYNADPKMVILSTGNVGIGTAAPAVKMHISGTDAADTTYLRIENKPATAATHKSIMEFWGNEGTSDGVSYNIGRIFGEFIGGAAYSNTALVLGSASGSGTFNDEITLQNGIVGIGTAAPDAAVLHVYQGSAGTVTPHSSGDDLVIEANTDGGLTIVTPDANSGRILWTSPSTTGDIGARITYQQSTNLMSIGTAGGEIFCSGGNVGIGNAAPSADLHVFGSTGIPGVAWGQLGLTSTSSLGANQGGSIIFGGKDTASTYDDWAGIAGLKENAVSGEDGGYLAFYTKTSGSSAAERMRIDSSGNVGIGDSTPDAHFKVANTNINSDDYTSNDDYYGIYSSHGVTGAAGKEFGINDEIYGIYSVLTFTDAIGGGGFGNLTSGNFHCYVMETGLATSLNAHAIYGYSYLHDGAELDNLYGSKIIADVDGGTVDNFIYGQLIDVDIESGISNLQAIYGLRVQVDADTNPSSLAYNISNITYSNIDYGYAQYDSDNTTNRVLMSAGGQIDAEGTINASQALDYAEYFESKDGSPIAVGSTVKLDGDKIVACEEGDTPLGVVRPVGAKTFCGGSQEFHWKDRFAKDDYGADVWESFTKTKWSEEITFEEYIKRGKDETGGAMGGILTDSKVEGSKAIEAVEAVEAQDAVYETVVVQEAVEEVLWSEEDELPEGVEAGDVKTEAQEEEAEEQLVSEAVQAVEGVEGVDEVPDTYFREHKYHSDRLPDGVSAPDDAEVIEIAKQRQKLNPDFDESMEYSPREDRDEWHIVGLLGQIPITKGQPTGNWIKMKDVSDTVEMYFVK